MKAKCPVHGLHDIVSRRQGRLHLECGDWVPESALATVADYPGQPAFLPSLLPNPLPKVGDRVRMTGIMPNDPCPLEVGETGTVTGVGGVPHGSQIFVKWDSARSLILLATDPYEILQEDA